MNEPTSFTHDDEHSIINLPWWRSDRAAVAFLIAFVAGGFAFWHITYIASPAVVAYDFTWGWRAARFVLQHVNPYDAIQPTGPYPFNSAFKYPLPFAVLSIPTAYLSPQLAMAVVGAVGAGLFAFGLTRDGYHRLPLLASAPVLGTLMLGQTSLIVAGAALLPALAWLGFCVKPTMALTTFAYRPHFTWAVGGTVAACVACLFVVPSWPVQWLQAMMNDPATHWYVPALRISGGPLLLLAALRWRTPEARVLLALAVIPQNQSFYSGVPALLVARTFRESLILSLSSILGNVGWAWYDQFLPLSRGIDPIHQAPWLILSVYLPALVLVLRRPNIAQGMR